MWRRAISTDTSGTIAIDNRYRSGSGVGEGISVRVATGDAVGRRVNVTEMGVKAGFASAKGVDVGKPAMARTIVSGVIPPPQAMESVSMIVPGLTNERAALGKAIL